MQAELVFPGNFNEVVGNNKGQFLQECTDTVSKSGSIDVACLDVRQGSIIVTLGGSSDAVSAAAQEVVADGLELPSFEVITEADLNECADENNNDCHAQAICTNTIGSYSCACKEGFVGNGKSCVESSTGVTTEPHATTELDTAAATTASTVKTTLSAIELTVVTVDDTDSPSNLAITSSGTTRVLFITAYVIAIVMM